MKVHCDWMCLIVFQGLFKYDVLSYQFLWLEFCVISVVFWLSGRSSLAFFSNLSIVSVEVVDGMAVSVLKPGGCIRRFLQS